MAKRLGVPATTIQRRRKHLEDEILTMNYALDLKPFGWRRIQLLVSTTGGRTRPIAKEITKLNHIVDVSKSIGDYNIDLQVAAIVRHNTGLLDALEQIRSVVASRMQYGQNLYSRYQQR